MSRCNPSTKYKYLIVLTLVISSVILILTGCSENGPTEPPDGHSGDGNFYLRIIDVGQASSVLITSPDGFNLIYDLATGEAAETDIIPLMDSLGVDFVDMSIVSHYDGDHIGGADEFFSVIDLEGYCYDHGETYSSNNFLNYEASIGEKRRTINSGDTLLLGNEEVVVACMASNGNGTVVLQENDRSVGCIISYKQFDIWIGGDMNGSDEGERVNIEERIEDDCHIVECYVANHHGSRYSSSASFLEELQPDFCAISCGLDNPYGHPHSETLTRMHVWTSEIYRTDLSGTITVTVDETGSYSISTEDGRYYQTN